MSTRLSGDPNLQGLTAAGTSNSGRLRTVRSGVGLSASAAQLSLQGIGEDQNMRPSSQAEGELQKTLSKVTHEKTLLQRQLDEVRYL
jgi:hypothetical protein